MTCRFDKLFTVLLIALFVASCADSLQGDKNTQSSSGAVAEVPESPDDGTAHKHITLKVLHESGFETVSILFERTLDSAGPRVAELRLSLSPDLTFVSAQAGSALSESGKELIAQAEDGGVVRLVAVSASSVAEIGSGVLATVKVQRRGSGPSTAELLLETPLFAPAEANEGLLVDGKVTF